MTKSVTTIDITALKDGDIVTEELVKDLDRAEAGDATRTLWTEQFAASGKVGKTI